VRVTPSLDTLGSFVICSPPDPDLIQNDPGITFADSNYFVVWSDEKFGLYQTAVARVSPEGVALDSGVRVAPNPATYEYRPNACFDGERCLVVWYRSSTGIFGRFVNRDGAPEGDEIAFATGQSGGPDLAFDGTNYLVAWFAGTYPDLQLQARLVSPAGVLVGNPIAVATDPGCHRWADVAFDGTNYLVVWQTGDNAAGQTINAQFVSPVGELVGARFRVCGTQNLRRWWPAFAVADSSILVTWGQGTTSDIWGNVDFQATGLAGSDEPPLPHRRSVPTVVNDNQAGGALGSTQAYDILGRRVRPGRLRAGLYFVRVSGSSEHKIVRVK
jgi:hypothetical protein